MPAAAATAASSAEAAHAATSRTAVLYRMATPTYLCPFGLKAKALLRSRGYRVEDHLLTSRGAQDAFKAQHGVATTVPITCRWALCP